MTIPDSPALDLDALTALEQAASPAPWRAHHDEGHLSAVWFTPYSCYVDITPAHADLIVAMRNHLPALLPALAAARAERDEALETAENIVIERDEWRRIRDERTEQLAAMTHNFRSSQGEVQRLSGKYTSAMEETTRVRGELAEAREQAKQAQAVVTAAYKFADDMALFCSPHGVSYRYAEQLRAALDEAGATSAAAPKATCSCQWSPVQGRIWCDPCAAARDAVVEAAAAPQADDLPGMWEQADLTGGQTDAEPVPAGGEDGSGTADGEVPA